MIALFLQLAYADAWSQIAALESTDTIQGQTYALIIGISDYKDDSFKDLQYAHIDAREFSEYLRSPAGGSVPADHIRLLTDRGATYKRITTEIRWLEEITTAGDRVYFYFSGHGVVDSSRYHELGYLIAYDTHYGHYSTSALRLEDFNNMANTLSIKKKAQAILITDACHSGRIEDGDNLRGINISGTDRQAVDQSEVRIASCKPHQLSYEDSAWGGGRGAFSYYFIRGLKGLADEESDPDGVITADELEDYLASNLKSDKRLKKKIAKKQASSSKPIPSKQTPIVETKAEDMAIAIVNEEALLHIRQDVDTPDAEVHDDGDRSIDTIVIRQEQNPSDRYFKNLAEENIFRFPDLSQWTDWSKAEVVDAVIQTFVATPSADATIAAYSYGSQADPVNWHIDSGINGFLEDVKIDYTARGVFHQRLVEVLDYKAQEAIDDYLDDNLREINKREYYTVRPEEYELLADAVAYVKLYTDSSDYAYTSLTVKEQYFRGIADRFRISLNHDLQDRDLLVRQAIGHQRAAYRLDDRCAYVLAELGLLAEMQHDDAQVEHYLTKAIDLAPLWSLPKVYLSKYLASVGRPVEGLLYADQALELRPDYYNAHLAKGVNAMQANDYLTALESFIQAKKLNDRHYLPYENLAYLYTDITWYQAAEHSFQEAEIRKPKQLTACSGNGTGSDDEMLMVIDVYDQDRVSVLVDTATLGPADLLPYFYLGRQAYQRDKLEEAKKYLSKVLEIDEGMPLAYRYLGDIARRDSSWLKADLMYNLEHEYYKEPARLEIYLDSLYARQEEQGLTRDIMGLTDLSYPPHEIDFLRAHVYEHLGLQKQEEDIYEDLTREGEGGFVPYQLLWSSLEERGLFMQARAVIERSVVVDSVRSRYELLAHYYRRMAQSPSDAITHYDAAIHLYQDVIGDSQSLIHFDVFLDLIVPGVGTYIGPPSPSYDPVSDALEMLTKAADLMRHDKAVQHDLLEKKAEIALEYLSDFEMYKACYTEILDADPDNASARYHLADEYEFADQYVASHHHLRHLYDAGQLTYDYMYDFISSTYLKGDYAAGDAYLRHAIQLSPVPDMDNTYLAAFGALIRDDYAVAGKRYEALLTSDDQDHAEVYYTLGRIAALQGNEPEAIRYIEAAISRGFDNLLVIDVDPALQGLYDDPAFLKVRQQLGDSVFRWFD